MHSMQGSIESLAQFVLPSIKVAMLTVKLVNKF